MRLFYGLSLPQDVRVLTAQHAKAAAQIIPGRYALPENHHITLAFIGETADHQLAPAQEILARCISCFPAPRVTLEGYSHFGRAQNGILILSAYSNPSLVSLNLALKSALSAAGLPCDPGPFSPHVTLARHADTSAGYPPAPPPVSFTALCAHLYLSARDSENVLRYTPIFTAKFTNPGI